MKKTLLIAGALFLATSASSAFAQGYNSYGDQGYYGRQGSYGGQGYLGGQDSYGDYVRLLRACQRHERLHEELGAVHADEHYQGLESRGDHRDLHDAIDEAHDAYHDDHPRADNCDGVARSNSYGMNGGYGYAPGYGYRSNNYGNNGMSFGFRFGR